MKLDMMQTVLNSKVNLFSRKAVDARQVSTRLRDLMPARFRGICASYRGTSKSVAQAERRTLADEKYILFLDELVETSSTAVYSRIQYETHLMLVQARQSLRYYQSLGGSKNF